ncbi:MAG: hypothetical protein RL514_977 [Verrucomicrobiota bacterium]|jgi:superfamily II DNA or RNA helicase
MPKAQHPKAASFVRQRLFADVSTFAELETRIAALPEEQARGNAFEVFAEAYLATQRKHDATKVWPLGSVPSRILQSLGLAVQDYGVDGVVETALGQLNAYQVKFRTGRPALAWRELSTFMGLADSPQIVSRVLFTNCDDLPPVLNERQGFFCIRGSDLDRLEAADFQAIEAWLADAAFVAPRKQPQPHQTEALDALLPALAQHDRVSAIMACGTGKTLVALWVVERLAARRILVLLPSLALVRQTLHEWLHETSLPSLAYLCVCSDPTVKDGLDALATAQCDLDFQVTTNRASVREFLDTPFAGTKIVFSTYQSAQVVGEALKTGAPFDLGIFDEAHKTAGSKGRNHAFALEDTNLAIRKRLFLTATPRHYNPEQKNQEGDAQLVFSMDRPEVYGPQAYRLSFAEAARRGIICGYQVIVSVITSEMVTNELLNHGQVLVNGDPVRARQVANQIALRDAIEKYGVSKVFTFHRTVASAASFVTDGNEGVRAHLPEFGVFHVNGTMPTAHRERKMRDFRAAPRAVMSNARCLTEGVDVPAVDMVAFLSPKRSRIDIVQATGRAMRRSPGKTTGYVLIPLYVELASGETVESAVTRADFAEVWNVLQSLQEQDDVLAETIRTMCEERGRTQGFDDTAFQKLVEVRGPLVSLDALRMAIATSCVDQLGNSWDERCGQLSAFKKRFGHCRVTKPFPENQPLACWVHTVRERRMEGRLTAIQLEQLNQLGFVWQPTEGRWESMFQNLLAFKATHGSCEVPVNWAENPKLATWVANQRGLKNSGILQQELIERLNDIGFIWKPNEKAWDDAFALLQEFRRTREQDQRLRKWTGAQRQARKYGRLSEVRIQKLDSIGFDWRGSQLGTKAVASQSEFSGLVPRQGQEREQTWMERKWATVWEERFSELLAYKQQHGDCRVPQKWAVNLKLANWVNFQRAAKSNGSLSQERLRRLEEIGFVWVLQSNEEVWNQSFGLLLEYKRQHGDCKVPMPWLQNWKLGTWVCMQRRREKLGKLSARRFQMLSEIGFEWNIEDETNGRRREPRNREGGTPTEKPTAGC